jgi:hypothetical protein
MSDGRDIMKETYKIIKELSGDFDSKKGEFSDEKFRSTKKELEESLKWAKKNRSSVWLRTAEGTKLAKGCLEEAKNLEEKINDEKEAADKALDLKIKLESLAKIIATKASVMT